RSLLMEYEASLATRLPTLHYFVPHVVRPDLEPASYPNRLPAAFNFYSGGTVRERTERQEGPDKTAHMPWPPKLTRLAPQIWSRRSAPLFLHLMDQGDEMAASLHFFANVVNDAEQSSFIDTLFRVFDEIVPV